MEDQLGEKAGQVSLDHGLVKLPKSSEWLGRRTPIFKEIRKYSIFLVCALEYHTWVFSSTFGAEGGAKAQLLSRSSTRRSSFHGGGVCGRGGRKSLAVVVVLPNTGTLLTVEIEIIGHILVML